jgi:hypothetical protein
MTITSTVWPLPVDDTTPWRTIQLKRGGDPEVFRVRAVPLWGIEVFIDEDDRVLCDGCLQFIDVEQLGKPGTGHRVAIDNIKRSA